MDVLQKYFEMQLTLPLTTFTDWHSNLSSLTIALPDVIGTK